MKKFAERYFHQWMSGLSFGLTTAVITSLGLIIGMWSATSSKLAMISAVIITAVADGLSDSVSMHTAEEAQMDKGRARYTEKEIWLTTIFTFLSVCGFSMTFTIPIILLPLYPAVIVSIAWGFLLIIFLNLYIAKLRKTSPIKVISEHILLTLFVIIASYLIGNVISMVIANH
ncbi:MAG: hypothetical protein QXP39_03260 [Candidatus Aenigmatarchaeota archaeon]